MYILARVPPSAPSQPSRPQKHTELWWRKLSLFHPYQTMQLYFPQCLHLRKPNCTLLLPKRKNTLKCDRCTHLATHHPTATATPSPNVSHGSVKSTHKRWWRVQPAVRARRAVIPSSAQQTLQDVFSSSQDLTHTFCGKWSETVSHAKTQFPCPDDVACFSSARQRACGLLSDLCWRNHVHMSGVLLCLRLRSGSSRNQHLSWFCWCARVDDRVDGDGTINFNRLRTRQLGCFNVCTVGISFFFPDLEALTETSKMLRATERLSVKHFVAVIFSFSQDYYSRWPSILLLLNVRWTKLKKCYGKDTWIVSRQHNMGNDSNEVIPNKKTEL